MNIKVLPSARDQDVHRNYYDIIKRAENTNSLGKIKFDASIWFVDLAKGSHASSRGGGRGATLFFTKAGDGGRSLARADDLLYENYVSLLKAMVVLREEAGAKHLQDHREFIRAGRFLHDELEDIDWDPCYLRSDHFYRAASKSAKINEISTAYKIGGKLREIADFINKYSISQTPIDYRNPNRKDNTFKMRLGEAADARRSEKLPSECALNALVHISNLVEHPSDVLLMRTVELLVCGGWRISELLRIPVDCEVEDTKTENGKPVLDDRGNPVVYYGIRYFGMKGATPLPKWIPTAMVPVAKRAIADIRALTEPARKVARRMIDEPERLAIPGFEHLEPGEMLSVTQLAAALGLASEGGMQWCRGNGVPTSGTERKRYVRIGDAAAALAQTLPAPPEALGQRIDEFLFLVPRNFTHQTRGNVSGVVEFITQQKISDFLGGKDDRQSIFDRFGIRDKNGDRIVVTSHQFRHYLNTHAQQGGMSQLEIARWSGRREVDQNAAYDHVASAVWRDTMREALQAGQMRGPIADAFRRLPPIEKDLMRDALIPSAHFTPIGFCNHRIEALPCAKHAACAGCAESMILKGDPKQRAQAQMQLDGTVRLLELARKEEADGTYGAAAWVEAHRKEVETLKRILRVHDDPSIPDGTFVDFPGGGEE